MSETRSKSLSMIYNGTEAWKDLEPYVEQVSYVDAVEQSDTLSISLSDRDIKWIKSWAPKKTDRISFAITTQNWNYIGEKRTIQCGDFIIDDFTFSAPPIRCKLNGVSSPVQTDIKEKEQSKTWEAATLRLIANEIAGKYGLQLEYDSAQDIQIAKIEQSNQTDGDFLKSLCQKYGMGIKIYSQRLVIWNFTEYFAKPHIVTIKPEEVSNWTYQSTMQGTYTGAKVSYTPVGAKKAIEIMIGTEGRVYKTTQKADNEADARRIGESAILMANRKETTMSLTLPANLLLFATDNLMLEGFGIADGKYFIEQVSHTLSGKSYQMKIDISRIPDGETATEQAEESGAGGGTAYIVKKGDTLWDLAKRFYGDATKYTIIYAANQAAIEADAKRRGKAGSNNGYWIFPGLTITIP